MSRVLFSAKSEPANDWSGIQSRLQGISAPAGSSDLPVEPSATLAHDPAVADEPAATRDQPVSIPGDPLEILFLPSDGAVSLSPHQDILTEFQGRNRGIHFIE